MRFWLPLTNDCPIRLFLVAADLLRRLLPLMTTLPEMGLLLKFIEVL